ncbi:hypothetical protein C8R45DRAFT_164190 [Mycena sanguinolenta]|nr:hypothetical protein C8R45DRAFT_164190 [Mycena sanguinolenta]
MSGEFMLGEPRLPPELEHRIFQIAALARPVGIPALMLVARRVKIWVEPILYRVVFLNGPTVIYKKDLRDLGLPIFTVDALEERSPNSFGHVRHLCIDDAFVGDTALEGWLLACIGATNLYAWITCSPHVIPLISSFTNVQYLTIDVRALCGTAVPLPLFLTVTHLELLDFTDDGTQLKSVCRNILLIPRLTHIALNSSLDSNLSHAALRANTQLQCIVFVSPATSLDASPLLDDDRFVCIDEELDYYKDWLNGAVFGEDLWSFADAFLAARRAGIIERSEYRIRNGEPFEDVE